MWRQVSGGLMEDEGRRPLILNSFDYMGVDALEVFSAGLLCGTGTVAARHLWGGSASDGSQTGNGVRHVRSCNPFCRQSSADRLQRITAAMQRLHPSGRIGRIV